MKLIDKDALVAEIEKLKLCTMDEHMNYYSAEAQGEYNALSKLKSFIDTIEVKEVDLEKEIRDFIKLYHLHIKDGGRIVFENNDSPNFMCDMCSIAKHFFELGLKEQIMTSKLQQRISVLKMEFWTGLQTFEETEMTLSDAYNQGVDDILEELGLKAQKGE